MVVKKQSLKSYFKLSFEIFYMYKRTCHISVKNISSTKNADEKSIVDVKYYSRKFLLSMLT